MRIVAERLFFRGRRLLKSRGFLCIWVAALVIAVYQPVRHFDYVSLDDPDYVSDNPNVSSGLSSRNIISAFAGAHSANWHPLTWVSHMMDCDLFGLNPGAHHLVNVAFHAINSLLLLLLLATITGKLWRAALVAALFAFHPLHVESVAWIAERKDVLCALFWIMTIFAYVWYAQRQSPGRYAAVVLFFTCSLLSKPMAVTLPFVLLLLDYWPLCRVIEVRPDQCGPFRIQPQRRSWLIYEKLPLLALSIVFSVITFLAQRQDAMVGLDVLPLSIRLENSIVSYAGYLGKMLWPFNLAVIYPLVPYIAPGKIIGAVVVLVTLSSVALYYGRKHPYLLVGWLWYLGTLIPVIGLVQVGEQGMADRYTYLPLVGIFVAVVWGFAALAEELKIRRTTLTIVSAILLGACITATSHQLENWRDDFSLFTQATRVTAQGATAHALLADVLARRGENDQATWHLEEALRSQPHSAKIRYECGLVQAKQKKYEAAAANYAEAVQLRPDFAEGHNELGISLSKLGRLDEAVQAFTKAIERKPENAKAYNNRGIAWSAKGESKAAVRDYRSALQFNSNQLGALKNLAWLEATDKDPAIRNGAEAVTLAHRACELTRFSEPRALEILAASQAEAGDFNSASKTIGKAILIVRASQSPDADTLLPKLLRAKNLYDAHKPFRRESGLTQADRGLDRK